MLQNISVLVLQRRENFFNGCPVIHISDNTMLMQVLGGYANETESKTLHFSIFYTIHVYCKRELFFKQKSSSPTLDLTLDFVVLVSYLKCFAFGYITINAFCGQ